MSIAYTDGLVAVAWSDAGPVGVDLERDGPGVDGMDRQAWTRREAALKAGDPDLPTRPLPDLPPGYVGTVIGHVGASTRIAVTARGPRPPTDGSSPRA